MTRRYRKSWFRPLGKTERADFLTAVPVEIDEKSHAPVKLIVTIPGVCGNAVKRNRFRRMIRGYLSRLEKQGLAPRKTLWIRLSRSHRLDRKIQIKDWKPALDALLSKMSS